MVPRFEASQSQSRLAAIGRGKLGSLTGFTFLQHNTIEAVLQRGEKLDDLVAKSEELSMSSKAFYTTVSFSCQLIPVTGMTLKLIWF